MMLLMSVVPFYLSRLICVYLIHQSTCICIILSVHAHMLLLFQGPSYLLEEKKS